MFRQFLFKLVLEDAIQREERAYRFYEQAAAEARQPEAARLLRRLCAEELRHRVRLEEMQRRGETSEVELSDPEETSVAAPGALERDSGPAAVLEVALNKELQAVRYYEVLSRRGPLRGARAVFRRLCREEQLHVRWVRRWQQESGQRGGAV